MVTITYADGSIARLVNGGAPATLHGRNRTTGERYEYEVKLAWDRRYYRAGDSEWTTSRSAAIWFARENGTLKII